MPLNTPENVDVVIDRAVNDVFLSLQEFGAKPSLKNSWLNSLIVAYSNRVFDFYFALDQAALECLPDTAVDNLDRWGAIYKVTRTAGKQSQGQVAAGGTVGSIIQKGSILVSGDGFEYETQADVTIANLVVDVSSITFTGGLATLTTVFPISIGNALAENILITVTGADQSEYNVTNQAISAITSATTLTYAVTGSPATATGANIDIDFDIANLIVNSVAFDIDANQDGLASLTFESPIVGVDDIAGVNFQGITGGLDQESTEDYRARVLDRIQNPVAHFNVSDIVFNAKKVSGVTRVFVFEITPDVGQVTVYFMRDNDDTTAIPSGAEVTELKIALDLIRPANTAPADLIVLSPTAVPQDFIFSSVAPGTASMKTAVENSLIQFFKEETSVAVDVLEDAYRSIIFNTVDTATGESLESFALSSPSGNIPVAAGEIATLGNIVI